MDRFIIITEVLEPDNNNIDIYSIASEILDYEILSRSDKYKILHPGSDVHLHQALGDLYEGELFFCNSNKSIIGIIS
jgi:hypothetical protein